MYPRRSKAPLSLLVVLALISCLANAPLDFPGRIDAVLHLSERGNSAAGEVPFSVVSAEPQNVVDIAHPPLVTFVFSRALRTATTEGSNSGPAGFSAHTQSGQTVEGSFRWVGLHGVIFQPKNALPGATQYNITASAGVQAADGSRLAKDYVLSFATAGVELVGSIPEAGSELADPKDSIQLRFSQPVSPEELTKHLTLSAATSNNGSKTLEKSGLPFHVTSASGSAAHDPTNTSHWLRVLPAAPLPVGSEIQLSISKGLVGLSGPIGTQAPIRWSVTTHGPFALQDLRCPRVNLGRCQAHRDLSVAFTTPVSPVEFERHLKLAGPRRPAAKTASNAKSAAKRLQTAPKLVHTLNLDPEYGDRFEVKLLAGMRDQFGQILERDSSVIVEIEAPYVTARGAQVSASTTEPNAAALNAEIGSPPEEPHRLSLPYSLQFGIRGSVIEAGNNALLAGAPTPRVVKLGSVNLPSVGLRQKALPEPALVRWLGRRDGGLGDKNLEAPWEWFNPGAHANLQAVRDIPLATSLSQKAQLGVVLLEAKALGSSETLSSLLTVTDLGISAHVGRLGGMVWVTHLSSGKPAALSSVSVYSKNGTELLTRHTDENGLAEFAAGELFPAPRYDRLDTSRILVAHSEQDWTYQRLEPSLNPNPQIDVDVLQNQSWVGFVFTDRGVYRPGDHVRAGGYFRKTSDTALLLKAGHEFEFTLTDQSGEILSQGQSKLDAFGSFALDLALPKSVPVGSCQLSLRLSREPNSQFSASFQVLEYKPAEFKVSVTSKIPNAVHGSELSFETRAEYLYGAPMAEAQLSSYFTGTEVRFTPPGYEKYVTTDAAFLQDLSFVATPSGMLKHEVQTLDAQGIATSNFSLEGPSSLVPLRITQESEVQDLSAQTQTARASVLLHPAEFYLALQPPKQRLLTLGTQLPAEAIAVSFTGKSVSNVPVQLQLLHRNFSATIEDRPANPLYYNTRVRDSVHAECPVLTGVKSTCRLRVSEPGYYVLRASAQDSRGNPSHASFSFYAVDDRVDAPTSGQAWREGDRRLLGLETDLEQYKEGETAKVLIKSPFRRATALISVERGGVLWRKVQEVEGPTPTVSIPVAKEFFPNAYVSVHLLRGRVADAPKLDASPRADIGAPQYRVGYTTLKVNPDSRRISVKVTPARSEYRPGQEVDASVQLLDAAGKTVKGSVTLYVVDEGTLALTNYQTPDPLSAFVGARPLGLLPLDNRNDLAQFIYLQPGKYITPYGWETANPSGSGDKGYEVGDGDAALRSDFRTTIFFEAGRAVGADGRAEFKFRLPDNLSSFRIMAIAAAEGDRFGSGQANIAVNKQLMLRPQLPRVLRTGDSADVAVVISANAAGKLEGSGSISLSVKDPKGNSTQQSQTFTLRPGAQTVKHFKVTAAFAGESEFEFAAVMGRIQDRMKLKRKTLTPSRLMNAAAYGSFTESAAVSLASDVKGPLESGTLRVEVRDDALVGLDPVFASLEDYPYGCTEQLASRIIPHLAASELLTRSGSASPPFAQNKRLPWIDEAFGELVKHQSYSGRFAFWQGETAGPIWLTAYALQALELGQQAGYFIPRNVRSEAASALERDFDSLLRDLERRRESSQNDDSEASEKANAPDDEEAQTPNDEEANAVLDGAYSFTKNRNLLRLSQAAYVADTLASLGLVSAPKLRRLLAYQKSLPLPAKAQVLHALLAVGAPKAELKGLLNEVLGETRVGDWQARVENQFPELSEFLDSPARSTAWVLRAVLAFDPAHPMADKLARGLASFRRGESFRSPQESAWTLLALAEYRRSRPNGSGAQNQGTPQDNSSRLPIPATPQLVTLNWAAQETQLWLEPGRSQIQTLPLLGPDKQAGNGSTSPQVLQLVGSGKTPIYYSVSAEAKASGTSSQPLDAGFSLEKYLRPITPAEVSKLPATLAGLPLVPTAAGQMVLVELLLESTAARDQVVIEDPLPAGLEALELNLETTSQSVQGALSSSSEPQTGGWSLRSAVGLRREVHDDRVVLFLPHVEPGIHRIRYLARASLGGRFVMPATRVSCMYEPEVFGQTAAQWLSIATGPHS